MPSPPPRRAEYDRVNRGSIGAGGESEGNGEDVVFGSEFRDHPIDNPPEVSGGHHDDDGHDDDGDGEENGDAQFDNKDGDDEEGALGGDDDDEYESFQDLRDELNGDEAGSRSNSFHRAEAGGAGGDDEVSQDGTLHDIDVALDPTEAIMIGAYRRYRKRRVRFLVAGGMAAALFGLALTAFLRRGRGGGGNPPSLPPPSSSATGPGSDVNTNPLGGGGSSSSAGGGDTKAAAAVALPPPPADLAALCDPKTMRGKNRRKCRKACTPSQCCFLPTIHALSCLSGNEGTCGTYETACSALDGVGVDVAIPGPPEDLAARCSESSLGKDEGREKCRDACNAAVCCEEPVEACVPSNPEVCDRYGPCAGLYGETDVDRFRHGSLFLPEPPANLAALCAPVTIADPKGYDKCNRYCKMSECCSEPIEACRVLNPDMCDNYEGPCATLYGETVEEFESSIVVPVAPDNLDDLCSKESISTAAGFKKCEDKCDLANCCNMPIEMCRVINAEACDAYVEPCKILYTTDENKYKGSVEVPEPPEGADISKLCGSDSVSTALGFTMCEDVCDRARCCDEKIEYCKVTNPQACDAYSACDDFLSLQFSGTVSAFDAKDQKGLLALAQEVVSVCSYRSLRDPQGLSLCRHICNDRFCCFDKERKRNCAGEYQCSVFAGCQNLLDWDEDHGGGQV